MACWCAGKCPHAGKAAEFLKRGQVGRAHNALRQILTAAPLCVESNLMLAGILCRNNHAAAALPHVERVAATGEPARIHYERGAVLRAAMRLDEAIPEFHAALMKAPDNPNVSAGYVGALEVAGDLDLAEQLAAAARDRFSDHPEILRLSAVIADAKGNTEAALSFLQGRTLSAVELLDRGRYLDKLGRHAEAWADWMAAKKEQRDRGQVYNAEQFERHVQRLKGAATPPRPLFASRAPELADDPAPVFVCGYPRSGTTLLETVLSSHSAIVAGDELSGLPDIIDALPAWLKVRTPYPENLVATMLGENCHVPRLLRDFYILQAQERIGFKTARRSSSTRRRAAPRFFTDKMPLNELHLPLIRILFPTAPVLRLKRHPLDVMVSCMSNWLVHGGFYASSLEACATHYLAVDGVAQHYRAAFIAIDRPGFREIPYEKFVADQAAETEALFAGLGLAIEPACLAPHENPRRARTLSYRQVQQPLHGKSVGRWRPYREFLEPAVKILRPILEREGYEL